ncbi:MAG: hypothetical protein ISR76_04250 [Planctomycetes bacterium]|nr:hypothetical protein [Planctomycetota bacterium]MBL7008185.1 hypothetical protein [Planctomycetota bacterium]
MSGRIRPLLLALLAALLAADAPAQAERPKHRKDRCSFCDHDPEVLARNKMHHGPFPFARTDSLAIAEEGVWEPTLLETEHFRILGDFPKWKVEADEIKVYRAELEALMDRWPEVKSKQGTLDPWYRIHLLGERLETLYSRFLQLTGSKEEDFLDPERNLMRGIGRYLGQHEKYEVMVFEDANPYREFMRNTWGLGYLKPQCWNNVDRSSLWFGVNLETDVIHHDKHLSAVVIHNIGHNMLNGYMHYSYEVPVWLYAGIGHWAEKSFDGRFDTFCSIEGNLDVGKATHDWAPQVRKMLMKGRGASFAQLIRKKSLAEIGYEDHLISWSKFDFLVQHKPEAFGAWLTELKTRKDANGFPDGTNMDEAQRNGFKEHFGWTLAKAEEEWQEWVKATYPVK